MTDSDHCPICGERLPGGRAASFTVQKVGGWRICARHKVFLRPSKFAGRCHECLGPIIPGEVVVLALEVDASGKKHWFVLHRKDQCEGAESTSLNADVTEGPYATLHLLPDAPVEVVKAAYKALAMKYHPDRPNGDAAKMQELNEAIAEIVK